MAVELNQIQAEEMKSYTKCTKSSTERKLIVSKGKCSLKPTHQSKMYVLNEDVFTKLQIFNQALANTGRKQQKLLVKQTCLAGSPLLHACLSLLVPQSQKDFSNTDFPSWRKGTILNASITYLLIFK